MSDASAARETDPSLGGAALDQGARAIQVPDDDRVASEEDVVATLRRQLEEKEAQRSSAETERDRERARADSEARTREQAEARARDAETARRSAEQTGQQTVAAAQLDAVTNSLSSHQGQMKNLAAQHAAAASEGDFTKAADLNAEMAILGGKIATLENGKAELEERIKTPSADHGRQADTPQPSADDRRETFIRGQPPLVQSWLRTDKGGRFFSDQAFQNRVASAAKFAQEVKGIDIASQDYIDFIEEQVGLRQAPAPTPAPQPAAAGGQQQPAPARGRDPDDRRMIAAPAGGSTGGSVRNVGGTTEVYLSKEEREQADRSGVSHSEWARHKRDLLNEGLIGPAARNR